LARSARIASYLAYNPPDISPDPDDDYAALSRHALDRVVDEIVALRKKYFAAYEGGAA
jgi:hypothetical protein